MNIDKKALKGFVDEIEASRERAKGETRHQSEIFKKIKGAQLDAKAVRIVLQRRAMGDSKRDEQDYYVHAYELALGGKKTAMEALEQGASTREAAKAGGISNGAAAALAKGAQKSSFVSAPHDPETGEVHEPGNDARHEAVAQGVAGSGEGEAGTAELLDSDGTRSGETGPYCDAQGRTERPGLGAGQPTESDSPVRVEQGDRQSPLRDGGASADVTTASASPSPPIDDRARVKAIASGVGSLRKASPCKGEDPGSIPGLPVDTRTPAEIVGEHPDFLRRVSA